MGTEALLSDQVLITLRRIIRAIDLHSRRLVNDCGLTGPQLLLLKEIAHLEEVSVGGIAKQISLSNATVTDILDRLEKRGLVQRTRSASDKRRVLVKVTEEGMRTLLQAPPLLQEHFNQEYQKLEEWEQTLIVSSLQRIASMMEAKPVTGVESIDAIATELNGSDKPIENIDTSIVPIHSQDKCS